MGFFDQVGGFFKSAWSDVKSGVSEVFNTGKGIVTNITSLPNNVIMGSQKIAGQLITTGGTTLSSLGSSLSFPLVIGAAVIGGILLLKK